MAKKKKMSEKARKALIFATLKKNVNEGVKFLDMLLGRKEWLSRMNMRLFRIESSRQCVAGNVFANGMNGYEHFMSAMKHLQVADIQGVKYGFHDDTELYRKTGGFNQYQVLQDLWVDKIKSLKKRKYA